MTDENYKWDEGSVEDCPFSIISFSFVLVLKGGGHVPMHIRTLKDLITLLQRIHAHLMGLQSRTSRVDTIRDKRTRGTGWRGDSAVDEREDRVSTDFVGFYVEVLHFGEGEVFGCDSLCFVSFVFL